MTQRLLIVGASVRPLLASAGRAGFEICAFDFFADWDAQYLLDRHTTDTSDFPGGTIQRIDRFEEVIDSKAWHTCDAALICGGFENHFDLVRRIADRMPVFGPGPDSLEKIANSVEVFDRLSSAGFHVSETRLELTTAQTHDGWLRKLVKSSSGLGVRRVNPEDLVQPNSTEVFFQKEIDGDSVSALYVSSRDALCNHQTALLGISRQLVGDKSFGASEFRYCGSVGPVQLSAGDTDQIVNIGEFLAFHLGTVGVWGVDFIVNRNGVWPVDVNPRITASAELFESSIVNSTSLLTGTVDLHVRSCDLQLDQRAWLAEIDRVGIHDSVRPWVEGKAVLFHCGEKALVITASLFSELRSNFDEAFIDFGLPGFSIADVPCSGQTINVGHPILTLRVRCKEEDDVRRMLDQKAKQIFHLLGIRNQADAELDNL